MPICFAQRSPANAVGGISIYVREKSYLEAEAGEINSRRRWIAICDVPYPGER